MLFSNMYTIIYLHTPELWWLKNKSTFVKQNKIEKFLQNDSNKSQESLESFNYCYHFTIIEKHSNHSVMHALAHRLPPVTSGSYSN